MQAIHHNMDLFNKHILKLLQKNARISNAEIGRRVGLSSPAVSERIKKMEDAGVIRGYGVQLSPYEIGYQITAIISLRVFMGRLRPFLQQVDNFKEIVNCYRITGNENIIMEVVLSNQKHLEELINQLIQYGETKTNVVLSRLVENNIIE
ncbi:MAG: Lrp/AsnC family transcriptional regulator [Flavobacteriaceae bacterium]|nr:Lrp/AsnC family transcriptional regulator [Flavobacteriaceae bacterium]